MGFQLQQLHGYRIGPLMTLDDPWLLLYLSQKARNLVGSGMPIVPSLPGMHLPNTREYRILGGFEGQRQAQCKDISTGRVEESNRGMGKDGLVDE